MRVNENLDIWAVHDAGEVICITTNGSVMGNGACIMGGGTALQAKQRFPDLPYKLGTKIQQWGNHLYYFPEYRIIAFPVKYTVQENASIGLIEQSCVRLMNLLSTGRIPGDVYLPKPGCALGGLTWEEVRPVIEPILSDQVIVVDFRGYKPFTGLFDEEDEVTSSETVRLHF